jgi:eukaryotic-like serine/threonine-protein kinase
MLDALAPLYLAPPALKDAEARANAGLEIAPGDAELHLVRAYILGELGEWSKAESAVDASLKHDPRFGAAWSFRGSLLGRQGKHAEAIAAWDRCVAISANATSCLRGREGIHEIDGECAAAEPDLRTMLSLEDAEPSWYFRLAKVLFAQGRPREGVEAAIAQLQQHLPPAARKEDAPLRVHESYGEFDQALTLLDSLEAKVATSNEDVAHGSLLAMRSFLTEEMGHPESSVAQAEAYLKKRSAWMPSDDALTSEPIAWNALRLAGKLDPIELAKKRTAWFEADSAAVKSAGLAKERTFYAWIVGWAWTAQTPDEAKAAMDAMPSPAPPIWDLDWSMVQGRTLLLAGRIDDALAVLRPLARSCRALEGPIEQTRGVDLLGRALEASGDTKGACAAYATVLGRWGAAKPGSITADHARARVAALKCP